MSTKARKMLPLEVINTFRNCQRLMAFQSSYSQPYVPRKTLGDYPSIYRKQSDKTKFVSASHEALFQKCIDLLESYQLPSGEIPLFCSPRITMEQAQYKKTVFLTAVQAALHLDIPDTRLKAITERSLNFLKKERSSNGLWRFFGKSSYIDPDIDDSFATLCALRKDPEVFESLPEILNRLQYNKTSNGLYNTWFRNRDNSWDLTVNVNLLLYFILLKVDEDLILDLLNSLFQVFRGSNVQVSRYYLSPDTLQFSMHSALRELGISHSRISYPAFPSGQSKPWFIQNSKMLYYSSPILEIVFLISFFHSSSWLWDHWHYVLDPKSQQIVLRLLGWADVNSHPMGEKQGVPYCPQIDTNGHIQLAVRDLNNER